MIKYGVQLVRYDRVVDLVEVSRERFKDIRWFLENPSSRIERRLIEELLIEARNKG